MSYKLECRTCKQQKDTSEFGAAPTKRGYKQKCRQCWSVYMKEYYKKKPEKYLIHKNLVSKNDVKYKPSYVKHSVTEEEYNAFASKYNGKCWICKEADATAVDHDHSCCPGVYSCGKCVRGIVCHACNAGMGGFNDDPDKMRAAAQYVEDYSKKGR